MEPRGRGEADPSWRKRHADKKLDRFNRADPLPVKDDTGGLQEIHATFDWVNKLGLQYGKVVSHSITTDRLEPGPSGKKVVQPPRQRGHLRLGGGKRFEFTRIWEDVAEPSEEGHKADHELRVLRIGSHGWAWERRSGETVRHHHFRSDEHPVWTDEMRTTGKEVQARERGLKEKAYDASAAIEAWKSSDAFNAWTQRTGDLAAARAQFEAAKALGDKDVKKDQKKRLKDAKADLRAAKEALDEETADRDAAIRELKTAAKAVKQARKAFKRAEAVAVNLAPYDTGRFGSLRDFESLLTAS